MSAACLRIFNIVLLLVVIGSSSIANASGKAISSRELQGALFALMSGQPTQSLSPQFRHKIEAIVGGTEIMGELAELLEGGYLQEMIWRLHDVGDADKAASLEQLLSDVLEHEEVAGVDTQVRSRGYNLLHVVSFTNGMRGVFKYAPMGDAIFVREEAAYRFDKFLGLNVFPLTVMREIDRTDKELAKGASGFGAMQLFMPRAADAGEIAELIAIKLTLAISEDDLAFASAQEIAKKDSDHPAKSNYESFVPPMPKKARTLQFLIRDKDILYEGNYMFPMKGRSFATDGGKAFKIGIKHFPTTVEKFHVDMLRAHPEDYFSDAYFLARLEKITLDQIEEVLHPVLAKHSEPSEADNFKEVYAAMKKRIDLYISVVGEGM